MTERTDPSESFVSMTRNPKLRPPVRVERTIKRPGDLELTSKGFVRHD